jgi:hypothetical protein
MAVSGAEVRTTFDGEDTVLALAEGLVGLPGVRHKAETRGGVYFALLFDWHEIIFAEGAPTESFRPGPMALAGMTALARAQIAAMRPWTAAPRRQRPALVRRLLTLRETRALAARRRHPAGRPPPARTLKPGRPPPGVFAPAAPVC